MEKNRNKSGVEMVKYYSKLLVRKLKLEHQNRINTRLYSVTVSCMDSYKGLAIFHHYYYSKEGIEAFYSAGYKRLSSH